MDVIKCFESLNYAFGSIKTDQNPIFYKEKNHILFRNKAYNRLRTKLDFYIETQKPMLLNTKLTTQYMQKHNF